MGQLYQTATMLTDLADMLTEKMAALLNDRPGDPQAVGVWQKQIARLGNKANELRASSNQLLVLDADQRLDSIANELSQITQATDKATKTIADIQRINDILEVVAKLVTIIGDIVLFATAPTVGGANDILTAIRTMTKSAKKLAPPITA